MSFVDFYQTAEDHCHLTILVKQVGSHLKPKSLNFVYECISKVRIHQVPSPQRTIYLRYVKQYQQENSEWGDFQAHRKVLGLICVGKCNNENEVNELYKLHEDLKEQYGGTLFDSRLILLGLNQDGSALEKRLRRESSSEKERSKPTTPTQSQIQTNQDRENSNHQSGSNHLSKANTSTNTGSHNSSQTSSSDSTDSTYFSDPLNVNPVITPNEEPSNKRNDSVGSVEDDNISDNTNGTSLLPKEGGTSHVLCYPSEENCAGDLESRMQEFVSSLFWVLESKRMDRRSLERQDRMALLTTPFEKKVMVGVDTDTRVYKKRCQGRMRKYLGDLCLLAGVPTEAVVHYQTALDILRSANDWLWLGAAYEGICSATVIMAQPPVHLEPQKAGFQRNLSFSMKRGTSAMKESGKIKTATLGKNFANGLDLSDSRSTQALLPDDLIDKYKEAVLQYGKFTNANIIEMEASLKACRVLMTQHKALAAADFLQNVVYINIPMTDEEKTQRFAVLAKLYGELGMHRKAGFFKRICAMQSVAPSNPKPAWTHCYHTLLEALSCYDLSLDPKDRRSDTIRGWPLVQLRVLHELIYSARRMGNPAIAIRHLTYLLHTMMDHLTEAEIREMAGVLESYTARCEGTPQALALEDGTILPPVPLLKFPTVKSCKLLDLPPHLRPVSFKKGLVPVEKAKGSESPFIYSPLQIFKTSADKGSKTKMDFCWVQGDVCETSVQVSNPLPFELHCSNMGLLTEGPQFESYPSSLSLPAESGPFHVKMTGVPKESGLLTVQGYTTNVLGVRSHCRLRDMPHIPENQYQITVVPSLPQLQVATSLPKSEMFSTLADSDSVVTSATACLYAGESCECQLRLTNVGHHLPVERVDLLLDSKVDQVVLNKVLKWNKENLNSQLPLQPEGQASMTLYLYGVAEFVVCDKLRPAVVEGEGAMSGSVSSGSQWASAVADVTQALGPFMDPGDGSWTLEWLLKLQHSGGAGLKADYCRQCSVALTLEVRPSVRIMNWEVHQAASADACVLVLDVENVASSDVLITYSDTDEPISITPTKSKRFGVEIPKCNISNSAAASVTASAESLMDVSLANTDTENTSQLRDGKSFKSSQTSSNATAPTGGSHNVSGLNSKEDPHSMTQHWDHELQRRVTSHVCDLVDIAWSMPSEKKSGSVSLESLWWKPDQLQLLQLPQIHWEMCVEDIPLSAVNNLCFDIGQSVNIHAKVQTRTDVSDMTLHLEIQPDIDHPPALGGGVSGASHLEPPMSPVCLLGSPFSSLHSKVEEGGEVDHTWTVVFLCAGSYVVDISCSGHSSSVSAFLSSQQGPAQHTSPPADTMEEWKYIPSLQISIKDPEEGNL